MWSGVNYKEEKCILIFLPKFSSKVTVQIVGPALLGEQVMGRILGWAGGWWGSLSVSAASTLHFCTHPTLASTMTLPNKNLLRKDKNEED